MIDPTARLTLARGHNLVVSAPPSPAALAPVLQGLLERLDSLAGVGEIPPRILAVGPSEAIGEWARVAQRLAHQPAQVAGTASPDRLGRLLQPAGAGLVFTAPEPVLDLIRRARLDPATIGGFLVIWPESWGQAGDDWLTQLLQDVPKETQRVFVTASPEQVDSLVERYAWRAPIQNGLAPSPGAAPAAVRVTPVSWGQRVEAIRDLIEQLDPESLVVWTQGNLDHESIRRVLDTTGAAAQVTSDIPVPAGLVIAYDLPSPAELAGLSPPGSVLLLAPPGTEPYVARLAPKRSPLHLRGTLERTRESADRTRKRILETVEQDPRTEFFTLAPLFEQVEATAIAAALLKLWQEAEQRSGGGPTRAETPVRLWISAGKRDSATAADLVAVLVRECEVPRDAIGKIEIRESFSLVELAPSAGAEQVAERLTGKTIRKRRLVARLDRSAPLVERVAQRFPRPKDRGRA